MKKTSGFTLIELMIVVTIIGVLAGVVAPILMGKSAQKADPVDPKLVQVAKRTETEPVPEPNATMPETVLAQLKIHLAAKSLITYHKVFTIFNASFAGTYTFVNKKDASLVTLFFPFPESTAQASDVTLKFRTPTGEWMEPEGVTYTLSGIRWTGSLKKNEPLTTEVRYTAQGNDRYIYNGPGSGRAGALKMDMVLDGSTSVLVPEDALQPTTMEPGHLSWNLQNLVTSKKIIVELPGTMSPTGRLMLFLRLAALAVFLFGAGFSYLNDLEGPGRLDHFRLGHFMLLAITYSLFFVVFTALQMEREMNPYIALAISAALSVPLLMIHVTRFWGKRFAFRAILPLALFTLAVVINGVYGEHLRTFIYIGLIVAAATFFTMTYSTWMEKRKKHRDEKQQQEEAAQHKAPTPPKPTADASQNVQHCLACGASHPDSRFCPNCGVPSPRKLICAHCGSLYLLPTHLLEPDKQNAPIHCLQCGSRHAANPALSPG